MPLAMEVRRQAGPGVSSSDHLQQQSKAHVTLHSSHVTLQLSHVTLV